MANTYLTRTQVAGNRQIFTQSIWFKLTNTADQVFISSYNDANNYNCFFLESGNQVLQVLWKKSGSNAALLNTTRKFRDTSAWYHVVLAVDTTQGTAANRIKLYVNGVQETSFSTATYPNQNESIEVNDNNTNQRIGALNTDTFFQGVASYVAQIDGTQELPTVFGETDATTGEWKIKTSITPSVAWGNNGFLVLKDGNSLTDASPNSNNFTVAGGTLTKTEDCPSNVFATMNPLALYHSSGGTLSNGNNSYVWSNYQINTRSTLGMPKGKFYWEQKCLGDEGSNRIGMCTSAFTNYIDTDSTDAHYNSTGNGGIYLMMSAASTSWQRTNNDTSKNVDTYTNATALATNNIIMNAVDVDAGKYWIGINGTWFYSGDPAAGSNPQITFTNSGGDDLHVFLGSGTNNSRSFSFNFGNGYFGTTAVSSAGTNASGNGVFEYDVPTGYTALSTKGLNL